MVKEEIKEEPIITNEEEILLGIKNKKVVDKWSHSEPKIEESKDEIQILSKKKNKKGKQVYNIPGGFNWLIYFSKKFNIFSPQITPNYI